MKLEDDFIMKMSHVYQIGCSVHFIPLNLHPFWQETLNVNEENFSHAVNAYQQAISLPIHTKMSDSDVGRVIQATRELLGKKKNG